MQAISPSALGKLAEMICGDSPYTHFPYRSSYYLTKFFEDIELDYSHDSSTRRHWVRSVLGELNKGKSSQENMPSEEMTKVIEHLLNPDHFCSSDKYDQDKAIDSVNECLRPCELLASKNKRTHIVRLNHSLGEFPSSASQDSIPEKLITFCPSVFRIPKTTPQDNLISIMMPFAAEFNGTHSAVKDACNAIGLTLVRADDLWNNATFIQDIFELIYCSKVVIVDFSTRNPNVMYETGIAHTLGKHVIPISQNMDDLPSDLRHHRALKYLPNKEGLSELNNKLQERLRKLTE